MKKTVIFFGALLISASLYFTSCKKVEVPTDSPIGGTAINSGRGIANPESGLPESPTGVAEVTEDQFNLLMRGDLLEVKRTAPHRYKGIGPVGPVEPYDPCAQDWINFNAFMAANLPAMQAWANAHCMPYRSCWQGQCVAIMFIVNPTRICGDPVKYERFQKVFEQ